MSKAAKLIKVLFSWIYIFTVNLCSDNFFLGSLNPNTVYSKNRMVANRRMDAAIVWVDEEKLLDT
ncbi:hypothetical protein FW778_20665 [Ginsengibacter hankyongi]|uniref:Uncharacterized protein n=1 Tax=Ginsengibacter hankyongi TaxID=2607284 RepID=A0A5J5IAI1_9BACT|nr:hypothetical protein [Ginsengibacter hankyongi]KAA9035641.1 hypothetical protein FW778_20665 [Ginsengibacter hankyongi]